ncbi:MAG: hypothetical protein CM1200mP18_03020 [Gammaproteobacteria bacterium]|nr:MAG: hypothetical protein CM1200mP18_03020 [Gammaproteobacteria bacterium]
MSEPDSGSDLFSLRSTAKPVEGGGRQRSKNMDQQCSPFALHDCSAANVSSHERQPSIWVDPVSDCHGFTGHYHTSDPQSTGAHDFNEVTFDDVFVPDSHLIGEVDMASSQATNELAYERRVRKGFLRHSLCLRL